MVELVMEAARQGKVLAAICHGPWMLCSAKCLKGRKVTGFYAIRDDVEHAGGVCGLGNRPVQRANTMDQQRTHVRRGLGITMKLHSEPPLGENGTCGNAHSFQGTPSEQRL